nr:hypothetical protein [Tanacetum cinerariifolium]
GHTNTVEDVQFHPKSTQEFCSVGDDSCLILWDERGGKVLKTKVEKAHNLDVHYVDWNRLDDNYILTWSADKSVCMFDYRKLISAGVGASVYQFMEHKALVNCAYSLSIVDTESHDAELDYTKSDDDDVILNLMMMMLNPFLHKWVWLVQLEHLFCPNFPKMVVRRI